MNRIMMICLTYLLVSATSYAVENRVGENSTTTGTGTMSLSGAKSGYVAFADVYTTSATVTYLIESSTGLEWEIGSGAWTDGTPDTLARTTVEASSNGGSKVNFSAGTKSVYNIVSAAEYNAFGSGGTDDQTASEVSVATTNFNGHLANDNTSNTVQECLDLLDDIEAGGMENPMTTAGDLIYGGTAGAPTRLAKGANNTFLGLDGSGVLGWQSSLSLDDSAAQFYNASAPTKMAKILCSGITAGQTRTMTWPDKDFTPAVLGDNLMPASAYLNYGSTAGSAGYGIRDNAGTMEYKNSDGSWTGIGSGGGGSSAGAQYDVQIADDAGGFDAVTGEFKYQSNTLYVGTGGMSQAKTSGQAGSFTLYSNNSTDTTGAGLKGPSATLANSYYLVFPSAEPAATAIWAHAAASSHDSAGSWLYPGTSANNLVQLDGSAKLPAIDGSQLTNVTSTPNDTETIYDSDGGAVSVTKNNTIVILGASGTVTPKTPAAGVNLMIQNVPGTTGVITIANLSGVYYGKADASGYITVNHKYVSGGANTDRIVLIGIDSTHYIVSSATGTWTDTAP